MAAVAVLLASVGAWSPWSHGLHRAARCTHRNRLTWARQPPPCLLQDDDVDMASLARRIGELKTADVPERVLLLIMDAIVPRQRLIIRNAPSSYVDLVKAHESVLVMVGRYRCIHSHGVQVSVQAISSHDDGTADIVLRGDRYCQVVEAKVCEGTWSRDLRRIQPGMGPKRSAADAWLSRDARVRWLQLDPPHQWSHPTGEQRDQVVRAQRLFNLVDEWQELVRGYAREKFTGHLDSILDSLGPAPDASRQPNEYCLWVAALINPYPRLGVANEVRPNVLMAATLEARLDALEHALLDSIARLEVGWI